MRTKLRPAPALGFKAGVLVLVVVVLVQRAGWMPARYASGGFMVKLVMAQAMGAVG